MWETVQLVLIIWTIAGLFAAIAFGMAVHEHDHDG